MSMMENEIQNSRERIVERFFRCHQWEEWTCLLRLQTAVLCARRVLSVTWREQGLLLRSIVRLLVSARDLSLCRVLRFSSQEVLDPLVLV